MTNTSPALFTTAPNRQNGTATPVSSLVEVQVGKLAGPRNTEDVEYGGEDFTISLLLVSATYKSPFGATRYSVP